MTQLIDLGKLRFHFAGDWAPAAEYEPNDVVKYGGNVYCYKYPLKTNGIAPTVTAYWDLMVEGIQFDGIFDNTRPYKIGSGVAYGGKVFICVLDAPTGNLPTDSTHWSQFADGIQWEGDYDNTKLYQKNDIARFGSSLFIAKTTALGQDPTNATYWDKFVEGISPSGVYNNGTTYQVNQLVAYGPNIYRALKTALGVVPTSDALSWQLFVPGMRFASTWATTTAYFPNDIVRMDNDVYICLDSHTSGTFATDLAANHWSLFVSSTKYQSTWVTAKAYVLNDIVAYGGQTYICKIKHASGVFATDLTASRWEKFSGGIRWRGNWVTATAYLTNDIIFDGNGSTYIAVQDFISGATIAADVTAVNLSMFAKGAQVGGVPVMTPATTKGKNLSNDGNALLWVSAYSLRSYIDLVV